MADKPSRGLVVYGDGLMRLISPSQTHIHSLTSQASCGFLALPHPPHHIAESEDERVVRELAQLLDAHDASASESTISERFMGLKAAIFTTNSSVQSFGRRLGFTVLQFDKLIKSSYSLNEPSQEVLDGFSMSSEVLKLLGFQGGKALETTEFDLVFVHIGVDGKENNVKHKVIPNGLEFVNSFVGGIMQIAQPGSEVSSRLHLSLLMGYGNVSEDEGPSSSILISQQANSSLSSLVPCQSFNIKGMDLRNNIRYHCPILIAQWQEAVTRKDMAKTFSFEEFKELGVNLGIPADRFLHEVAFKLWKAPKYGA